MLASASRPQSGKPSLLLVEDDRRAVQQLSSKLSRSFALHVAYSVRGALAMLEKLELSGAIVDISLPDGVGTDVIIRLRDRGVACPVLILSACFDREYASTAQLLGAEYLPKPAGKEQLKAFLRRATIFGRTTEQRPHRETALFSHRHGLTQRETEIVALAISQVPRSQMPDTLGVSTNTFKTHVRSLLKKAQLSSLRELARVVELGTIPAPPSASTRG